MAEKVQNQEKKSSIFQNLTGVIPIVRDRSNICPLPQARITGLDSIEPYQPRTVHINIGAQKNKNRYFSAIPSFSGQTPILANCNYFNAFYLAKLSIRIGLHPAPELNLNCSVLRTL
jgi:hypothetical protein